MIGIVFEDVWMDDEPQEMLRIDSARHRVVMEVGVELDPETSARARFEFRGMKAMRYVPTELVNRRKLYIDGGYHIID